MTSLLGTKISDKQLFRMVSVVYIFYLCYFVSLFACNWQWLTALVVVVMQTLC